ncbi:LOW QUALITY PROTEIN: allene oxide synthase 1, chloroplastic-like [Curcuma longa]|uniref:LOW QUALITY PROTEIN: allene oxide synthase 1, chloroplastic-like n=1 Tax=Curcuma longa TaxID=136217 RepID=UPI003D9ECE9B
MATAFLAFYPASPPSLCSMGRRLTSAIKATSIFSEKSATSFPSPDPELPLRKIPGDYGLPFIGPISDRLAYFYHQGCEEFFKSRMRFHNSTVFRVNMPPGPFIAADPRVIVLLDAASFPVLFDTSRVEKRDLLTGTFMPSTELTGGFRVLSYLDPSEPKHAPLKRLLFFLLSHRRHAVIPEFRRTYGTLFEAMEAEIAAAGRADFGAASDRAAFDFLARAFFDRDPEASEMGLDGPGLISKWVLFQLGPLLTFGLPAYLEDLLLHSFRLPPALIRADYHRLAEFFRESAGPVVDEAERLGISREEALHNILFATCFNAFGGMKILLPNLVKLIGRAGARLHGRLAQEVRDAVRDVGGGEVTMRALEAMPLTASAVYEALRIEPPVPMQYGRAKQDLMVTSHDAAFEVRAGEMLFGYQPFRRATRDARVFERPEEFVADRFIGREGTALLRHVLWSNGPETEAPTTENKQCAGKDFAVMVARLLLVEIFLRYDSFEIEVGTSAIGSSVKLTSLKKASLRGEGIAIELFC